MVLVSVPWVNGLGRPEVATRLEGLLLRHVDRFPFGAGTDGSATIQSPSPGSQVPQYSVVTVDFPSPLGPMDDAPVEGPLPTGRVEGTITAVVVNQKGSWVQLTTPEELRFEFAVYLDGSGPAVSRDAWMRRGAMLSLAQRAFTGRDKVEVVAEADQTLNGIRVLR